MSHTIKLLSRPLVLFETKHGVENARTVDDTISSTCGQIDWFTVCALLLCCCCRLTSYSAVLTATEPRLVRPLLLRSLIMSSHERYRPDPCSRPSKVRTASSTGERMLLVVRHRLTTRTSRETTPRGHATRDIGKEGKSTPEEASSEGRNRIGSAHRSHLPEG